MTQTPDIHDPDIHDKVQRQSLLRVRPAERSGAQYLSSLTAEVQPANETPRRVQLFFVPHKFVLLPADFRFYLDSIKEMSSDPDQFLLIMQDDINNELVPRWQLLRLDVQDRHGRWERFLAAEDQQPGWPRPPLLSRVGF